jgi:predicted PurR-regulated permease PerM
MLGIDVRAARAAWTVFLLALLIATSYAIRVTLAVLLTSLFFAYMLMPVVNFVEARLPRRVPRTVALAIVYLILLGAIVGLGITIGGYIVEEANSLGSRLPQFVQNPDWMNHLPLPGWLEPLRARMINTIRTQVNGKDIMPYLQRVGEKVISSLSGLLFVVLVPILAFFFLKDGRQLRDSAVDSLTEGPRRKLVEEVLSDVNVMLGQYIRALVLLAAATFTSYSIFFFATGAPYRLLLASIAAVLEFIPVVGPLTAGVTVILVGAFAGYTHLAWFAIFWVVYRLFQDYILSPNLMSAGVELHPILVLFGVLAGEQIAGIPGMFFSVPVIATLRVIFVRAQRARQRRQLAPQLQI